MTNPPFAEGVYATGQQGAVPRKQSSRAHARPRKRRPKGKLRGSRLFWEEDKLVQGITGGRSTASQAGMVTVPNKKTSIIFSVKCGGKIILSRQARLVVDAVRWFSWNSGGFRPNRRQRTTQLGRVRSSWGVSFETSSQTTTAPPLIRASSASFQFLAALPYDGRANFFVSDAVKCVSVLRRNPFVCP